MYNALRKTGDIKWFINHANAYNGQNSNGNIHEIEKKET